jgi:hypothetical protein
VGWAASVSPGTTASSIRTLTELGHSLGIVRRAFGGVDSTEYDADWYESITNYNLWMPVTFSADSPFDDYRRMAERSDGSYHQDHGALTEIWEAGSVDGELPVRRSTPDLLLHAQD